MDINFEQDFLEFKDQLQSYLYRLSANRQDTEDILHDTFIRAKEKLSQFKGKSSLKTWVFTVATNIARDNQRVKNRWALDAQDACKHAAQSDSAVSGRIVEAFMAQETRTFDIREHINYCFTCIGKNLELEQQIAVILKEIYAFRRQEIADILNVTEGVVKHLLFDGRKALQVRYNNRCAMINKQGACYQCAELNDVLQSGAGGPSDSMNKISSFGFVSSADEKNLDARLDLIRDLNPLQSNGAQLEDTILQILRETIGDH